MKSGYGRAKHSTALRRAGNPWAKYESSFCTSFCTDISVLLIFCPKSCYFESFSSWMESFVVQNDLALRTMKVQ